MKRMRATATTEDGRTVANPTVRIPSKLTSRLGDLGANGMYGGGLSTIDGALTVFCRAGAR